MRFFEKKRPEVFVHAPKLRRDKKTMKRMWGFTLIVTMNVDLAESCEVSVAKAWQYITERDSMAADILLADFVPGCTIDFFAEVDDVAPLLHLEGVQLGGLRMTLAEGGAIEFWFAGEHENIGGIHAFMKDYAFTRVYAAFKPEQPSLPLDAKKEELKAAVLPALDDMTRAIREGGVTSMSIQIPGEEPVVIDKAGAERIHAAAKQTKNRKRMQDPG